MFLGVVTTYVARTFHELVAAFNYFDNSYLRQATPEGPRISPKFPVQFGTTLHDSTIMVDPDCSRISDLVEGFHRGFKMRVN